MGILFINNAAIFIAGSTSGRPVGSYGGWLGFAFILLVYHIVLVWLVLTDLALRTRIS